MRISDWSSDVCSSDLLLGRFGVLDQQDGPRRHLAHGADHLGVSGVADQQDLPSRALVPLGLAMDLADQRAGGVEVEEVSALGLVGHFLGHAVGREIGRASSRERVCQYGMTTVVAVTLTKNKTTPTTLEA